MSIYKSKVLTATRSFIANTSLKLASPHQSQNLTVNIQGPEKQTEGLDVKYDGNEMVTPPNPYKDLKLTDAPDGFDRMLMEKDRMNEALKLIIDIIRNNPLIENDVIIAEYQILRDLIRLLTNADEVDLIDKGS